MKAAVVEEPGLLVVKDLPEPVPADYDAVCEILFGATCTGTDQHIIRGSFPFGAKYPLVLGHESIGRIIACGKKVKSYKEGDLVTRVGYLPPPGFKIAVQWGGFAEKGIARDHKEMKKAGLPAEQWDWYTPTRVLPPDFDPAAATMIITWRETFSFITRMGVGPGARVLVLGSGGNGLAFTAHATNLSSARVAVVGNPGREEIARSAGATDYFDYKTDDLVNVIKETCMEGFDFIIDAVGKKGMLDNVLPALNPDGKVSIYGIDDSGQCVVNPVHARGTFTYFNGGYSEAESHDAIVDFIRQGRLNARLWLDLDHPYALDDITSAFEAVSRRKTVKALVKLR